MALQLLSFTGSVASTGTDKDVYASGADNTYLKKLALTNKSGQAVYLSVYKKSSGGTKRAIAPASKSVPAGATLYVYNEVLQNGDKIQIDTDAQPIEFDGNGFVI